MSARSLSLLAKGPLRGSATVPGDKSISHRALMLGALAVGRSRVSGLLTGEDVLRTAEAMRQMGARVTIDGTDAVIDGVGVGGLLAPSAPLDMGNSGTSARLLMGVLTGHGFDATLVGDASLSRRPMKRVTAPLSQMGAVFHGGRAQLPLTMTGTASPLPIEYRLPVPSAQVKSAVLLAGLAARGRTSVYESEITRDHSERMLAAAGANIHVADDGAGRQISLEGPADLSPVDVDVPGDISSAAFPLVAGALVPGSEISIPGCGLNPTRTGLIDALRLLGAELDVSPVGSNGEPRGTLSLRERPLKGCEIPASLAPRMIDEYPALMVAAAFAEGTTTMRGLQELRVKESDRLAVMAEGLSACGVPVELLPDGIVIQGSAGRPLPGGAAIDAHLDHRIAMSFAVLGLHCERPVVIPDASPVETSFPGFLDLMESLGASGDEGQDEDGPAQPA